MTLAKQSTFLTVEDCTEISQLMDRKFAGLLKQRYFESAIHKDSQGVYAKVALRNQSGSFFYPVEARVAHTDHDFDERAAALFLIDYITEYFAEYFREDGDVFLPIDWTDYEWGGVSFQLKGQLLNLEAERLADALLAGNSAGDQLH